MTHILQEQKYHTQVLRERLKFSDPQVWRRLLIGIGAGLADLLLAPILSFVIKVESVRTTISFWVVLAVFTIGTITEGILVRDADTDSDIQWTRRLIRLMGVELALIVIGCTVAQLLSMSPYFFYAVCVFAVPCAAVIMKPIEDMLCRRYYKAAALKVARRKDLITIGIVGSYGKTEVKMILKTLLSKKYRVLATPPNFSAAMGIARTINEELTDKHQVFIAEMGAQQKGEIREMTQMARPRYGILTCISYDKKGTFSSPEAVAQSMNELMARLPKNGLGVFGSDGGYSDRMYAVYKGNKRNAGAHSERKCYMHAQHIDMGIHGSRFELLCEDGRHAWMETPLLGMYSIRNIAIAATIASELGMTMEEIAAGVKELKPVKHHLQLKTGDVNIIDDSLNKNWESAVTSLSVLREFPGRRVLVTNGFPDAEDGGYGFGTHINGNADHVILIGAKRTQGIAAAMLDSAFPSSSVRTVQSNADALFQLKNIVSKGDTILYEGVNPRDEEE